MMAFGKLMSRFIAVAVFVALIGVLIRAQTNYDITAFDNTGNTTFGNTSNNITATARYVRVTVTGSSNGGFASFYDLKVFGH